MEPVYDDVARDLEAVKASVARLKAGDHAPVTWWSTEQSVLPAVTVGANSFDK